MKEYFLLMMSELQKEKAFFFPQTNALMSLQ